MKQSPAIDSNVRSRYAMTVSAVIVAVCLALLVKAMAPVKRGSAVDFWKIATGIDLGGASDVCGFARGLHGDWYLYENQHVHDSTLFRVPRLEIESQFAAVVARHDVAASEQVQGIAVHDGYRQWKSTATESERNAESLLNAIKKATSQWRLREHPEMVGYADVSEAFFELRARKIRWYWATVAFEWVFLSTLMYIAARPFVRRTGPLGWSIHFGLLPTLFMLPVYLGYASFSFTTAGPIGGVMYPILLQFAQGGSCTELDELVLNHLPLVLEPISPSIGEPMALSGRGMPGPTQIVMLSILVGGITGITRLLLLMIRARNLSTGV